MRRTHLHLTDPQLARLRVLADRTGLNAAELVRRALDDYLRREGGEAPTGPGRDLNLSPDGPADRRGHGHSHPASG